MISVNLMEALYAGDEIERSVCSNVLLFCTQLTFDLILSHRDIFRLGIHPYQFYYIYWNKFSIDASFYPICHKKFFRDLDCQLVSVF